MTGATYPLVQSITRWTIRRPSHRKSTPSLWTTLVPFPSIILAVASCGGSCHSREINNASRAFGISSWGEQYSDHRCEARIFDVSCGKC